LHVQQHCANTRRGYCPVGGLHPLPLQTLNKDIEEHASRISVTLEDLHGLARELLRAHEYTKLLQAANQANYGPSHYRAEDERARLPLLLKQKSTLLKQFRVALYLTGSVITFSVLALVVTPYVALSSRLAWIVFVVGLGGFVGCIASYVILLRTALS